MKYTLSQFIDAMEENGWTKAKGQYYDGEFESEEAELPIESTVTRACAIGTGLLRLRISRNIATTDLHTIMRTKYDFKIRDIIPNQSYEPSNFWAFVTLLNDQTDLTIPEIARKARAEFTDKLDKYVYDDHRE